MTEHEIAPSSEPDDDNDSPSLLEFLIPLAKNWKRLVIAPLALGLSVLGLSYLLNPRFTARTAFLPPQQQQTMAASAIASLGALSGLVGGAANIKSPADQYVALMQSITVSDRIIDRFGLMKVYREEFRFEARKDLSKRVQIAIGKKDGLISVEVEDEDPKRSAEMANAFIDELRKLTNNLALTEAQQRRVFFEGQLKETRDRLTLAQHALQASGFNPGALKAEPKAAAETYAKLQAEVTASQVRLQTMRHGFADDAPEVQQQLTQLGALRAQLDGMEASSPNESGPDYVSKYRQFKYEETLFDLFSRQYELAKVDESREGPLIQVVDPAQVPEHKSWPKRGQMALGTALAAAIVYSFIIIAAARHRLRLQDPVEAQRWAEFRDAFARR